MVICTGYASRSGTEQANFEHYAQGRADWARAQVMRATGASDSHVRARSLGSVGAHRDTVDPHDRRVEISVHSNHSDSAVAH